MDVLALNYRGIPSLESEKFDFNNFVLPAVTYRDYIHGRIRNWQLLGTVIIGVSTLVFTILNVVYVTALSAFSQ